MSIGYWDVIENETGDKFACQRTPISSDSEFETTGWFTSHEAAARCCDELNSEVEDELAALPEHLR